ILVPIRLTDRDQVSHLGALEVDHSQNLASPQRDGRAAPRRHRDARDRVHRVAMVLRSFAPMRPSPVRCWAGETVWRINAMPCRAIRTTWTARANASAAARVWLPPAELCQ